MFRVQREVPQLSEGSKNEILEYEMEKEEEAITGDSLNDGLKQKYCGET